MGNFKSIMYPSLHVASNFHYSYIFSFDLKIIESKTLTMNDNYNNFLMTIYVATYQMFIFKPCNAFNYILSTISQKFHLLFSKIHQKLSYFNICK